MVLLKVPPIRICAKFLTREIKHYVQSNKWRIYDFLGE